VNNSNIFSGKSGINTVDTYIADVAVKVYVYIYSSVSGYWEFYCSHYLTETEILGCCIMRQGLNYGRIATYCKDGEAGHILDTRQVP